MTSAQEQELISNFLELADHHLTHFSSSPVELAVDRLAEAIMASGGLIVTPAIDDALIEIRWAWQDLVSRAAAATSEEELFAIHAEVPGLHRVRTGEGWSETRLFAALFARQALFHGVLSRSLRDTPKMTDRVAEILDLLVDGSLSPRTRQYLRWVAQCYLYGLRMPSLVLARAAIESALRDAVSDDSVRSACSLGPRDDLTLSRRIAALERTDRLSAPLITKLSDLVDVANGILHEQPQYPPGDHSTYDYLSDLRDILAALFPNVPDEDDRDGELTA